MASRTLRIGYPNPGTYGLTADQGSYALSGQTATLTKGSSASLIFQEDFKTGYTWGARPITSQSTISAQIGSKWQFIDFTAGHGAIDDWPTDSSRRAFRQQYVNSDDLDVIQAKFDPSHSNGTGRPTEIWWQWMEYRGSTFDFGPSKDFRWGIFRASEYGGNGTVCDGYGGFTNGTASGVQACSTATLNVQGTAASQSPPSGDPNVITSGSFVLSRATEHKVEIHIKVNTPGNADGAAEMWVDGVQVLSRTNVKYTIDAWTQGYIDYIQLGMTATNGGQAFADTSFRWMTDVKVSTSGYIG